MGLRLSKSAADALFAYWKTQYDVFAPMVMEGEGCFSDTDIVRYGKPSALSDICWNQRSDYSAKEILLAINETLFYFTEDQTTVPKGPEKDILIFLRSCDLHAVKRLDAIYLQNGYEDFYYARIREKVKFILMGCETTCASGFCVSMGTNQTDEYDAYIKVTEDGALLDIRNEALENDWATMISGQSDEGTASDADMVVEKTAITPDFVTENIEKVTLPKNLSNDSFSNDIWKEYGARCIGCGRCNFACPTCTCFTMQDIFYHDNPKVGERRRVWASCQVDGYTDVAGGGSYRKTQGDRMRFKVMHKVHDYEKRFGYPMCVGCGRCINICPEYISYSNCLNRLAKEEAE